MAKKPAETLGGARLACIRAAGITEFEGEIPGWGIVKLKLSAELVQPNPRAAAPITDATKPATVPKELEAAGVTPEMYAESLALAAALNPLA